MMREQSRRNRGATAKPDHVGPFGPSRKDTCAKFARIQIVEQRGREDAPREFVA